MYGRQGSRLGVSKRGEDAVLGAFSRLIGYTISQPDQVCSGLVLCPVGL